MVEVGGGKAVSLFLWVAQLLVRIWVGFHAIIKKKKKKRNEKEERQKNSR